MMKQFQAIWLILVAGILLYVYADTAHGAADTRNKGFQDQAKYTADSAKPPKAKKESQAEGFNIQVPSHDIDIILGRPTRNSVTLSVLAYRDMEGFISYGTDPQNRSNSVQRHHFEKDKPAEIIIKDLRPDKQYYYMAGESVNHEAAMGPAIEEGTFHTYRTPGNAFTFTVTADSHLDEHTDTELYKQTLAKAAADTPDFHIDLGDTFMIEKHASREEARQQYLAQRYYFGQVCNSSPLFLVLGNHDGESSRLLDGTADSLAVWSNMMRKHYFPNPVPDAFYSGNAAPDKFAGRLQDFYAWQWGDALFVVLDPYWYSAKAHGKNDNWSCSLGWEQYQWLRRTLEQSKAKFKFIFIHQLVGGLTHVGRGGTEAVPFFEWGGKNADGTDGFKAKRSGWPELIHQLLVRNHVSIVFHGHDHLFAKQELDGIVYQEVPQPGSDSNLKSGRAAEYGYTHGTILGYAGYLQVTVSPENVKAEYVRSRLATDATSEHPDDEIAYSYTIRK